MIKLMKYMENSDTGSILRIHLNHIILKLSTAPRSRMIGKIPTTPDIILYWWKIHWKYKI